MHEPNVARAMDMIKPSELVLDVGGWARPFNRANYVLDVEPYQSRGYYGESRPAQGGEHEKFTKDTWIQRDVCERTQFPFGDKEIDFVICSHTLEDIRDPLWVCSEMIRIAKRGYLEVPSREAESCRGIEPGMVGWSHHRWLVDIEEERIRFLMKYHTIHSHWRFSLPVSHWKHIPDERRVRWLFWEGTFEYSETIIHGVDNIAAELERFVGRVRPYPRWQLALDRHGRRLRDVSRRIGRRLRPIS